MSCCFLFFFFGLCFGFGCGVLEVLFFWVFAFVGLFFFFFVGFFFSFFFGCFLEGTRLLVNRTLSTLKPLSLA